MRLVVISDTHMPRRGRTLPAPVLTELSNADLIIHLGDFTHIEMVNFLAGIAPLRAVHGNNDTPEVRARFPETQHFTICGHSIRLLHGHLGGRTALAAARQVEDADIILFGHSHRAWRSEEGGRLVLNPGSPTDPRWSPYRAFALIDIEDEFLDARIVPLS